MTLTAKWFDNGREPRSPPNLRYPTGVDIDLSGGASETCTIPLPYPAERCGYFVVKCDTCSLTAMVTTAGRVDDPRSVRVKCKGH